jgi:3-deoxy-manno-octulosonate cytidylyltransferase (CMP-KDO synthetase)
MKTLVVIPARYESTRLPGKPLSEIGGSPMIVRVYAQVKRSSFITDIYVATDDMRIKEAVEKMGGNCVMTSKKHESGTDRIAEAVQKIGGNYDVILNVQGDEPFINPQQVDQLARLFEDADTQIATLVKKIKTIEELHDTNKPKVTFNSKNEALLFSRSTIPHIRGKVVNRLVEAS